MPPEGPERSPAAPAPSSAAAAGPRACRPARSSSAAGSSSSEPSSRQISAVSCGAEAEVAAAALAGGQSGGAAPRIGPSSGSARACCWPAASPPAIRRQRIHHSARHIGGGVDEVALQARATSRPPANRRRPARSPAAGRSPAGSASGPRGPALRRRPGSTSISASQIRRKSDVGQSLRLMPIAAARRLTSPSGLSLAFGAEACRRSARWHALPDGLVDEALALGRRLVGGDVGLRGRADVELEPPTPPAVDLAAPEIERADLGEPGVQLDGDRCPARLSCASRSTVRIGGSGVICSRSIGTSSPGWSVSRVLETNSGNSTGSRDQQVEPPRGEVDVVPRLDARRHQADGRRAGRARLFDADVIRAGQPGGDPHALARAAPCRSSAAPRATARVEPVVVQHDRPHQPRRGHGLSPGLQETAATRVVWRNQLSAPPAAAGGARGDSNSAAVEQHDVGPGRVVVRAARSASSMATCRWARQERRQVAGDRRVGRIRQPELLEARPPAGRLLVQPTRGKNPSTSNAADFVARRLPPGGRRRSAAIRRRADSP